MFKQIETKFLQAEMTKDNYIIFLCVRCICMPEMFLYHSNNQLLQGIYVIVFIQILLFFVHTWNKRKKIREKKSVYKILQ